MADENEFELEPHGAYRVSLDDEAGDYTASIWVIKDKQGQIELTGEEILALCKQTLVAYGLLKAAPTTNQ